jgi:cytochrome d ubiquinol oxidase subunit I
MEGNWETRGNVPLVLFAIPDAEARENRFEISIPSGASLILTHSFDGVVPGLNDFVGKHPPVAPVFYAFRVMVGVGMAMIGMGLLGAWYLWRRGTLPTLLLRGFVVMTFAGWVATLAGWYVTEIGRQPWLVTGVLTTADAVGPVPAGSVATTLAMYLVLYAGLLVAYIATLYRLASKGRVVEHLPGNVPLPARA